MSQQPREPSEQDIAEFQAKWEQAKSEPFRFIPPAIGVTTPPTAWESIPSPVRFAVWVWAVFVIAGVAGAVLMALLFVFGVSLAVLGS